MPKKVTPILLLDRATVYTCKLSQETVDALFGKGGWRFLPPKSPDLSMCDAAVFPNMKRSVGALGATTADEIWEACRKVRNEITPETCAAMDLRVWRNTKQVQGLKGGNFYDESSV